MAASTDLFEGVDYIAFASVRMLNFTDNQPLRNEGVSVCECLCAYDVSERGPSWLRILWCIKSMFQLDCGAR